MIKDVEADDKKMHYMFTPERASGFKYYFHAFESFSLWKTTDYLTWFGMFLFLFIGLINKEGASYPGTVFWFIRGKDLLLFCFLFNRAGQNVKHHYYIEVQTKLWRHAEIAQT